MLRKIWKNPQAVIGLALIVLICAVAILAPLLAPHAPDEVNPLMKYQAPSADWETADIHTLKVPPSTRSFPTLQKKARKGS